jgi:Ase1/PRC1/MAP65 family protein
MRVCQVLEMGSLKMAGKAPGAAALPESSCAYLLQELKVHKVFFSNKRICICSVLAEMLTELCVMLQMIWDEVGQDQSERERILGELEQECQEVYRSKVNSANMSRIQLHQALAESEAEFTNLLLSLGERSFPARVNILILRVSPYLAGNSGKLT